MAWLWDTDSTGKVRRRLQTCHSSRDFWPTLFWLFVFGLFGHPKAYPGYNWHAMGAIPPYAR
jgi:hypothetical protein